jgi:predicted ATPase
MKMPEIRASRPVAGMASSWPWWVPFAVHRVTTLSPSAIWSSKQASDLLAGHRLLTFTGSGGCGKTRLAIELARLVQDQFADGTWFVDLGPVRAGEHVLTEVAAVLGVVEPERGKTLAQAIASHLGHGTYLVVLDNCERLSGAVSSAAAAMLHGAAGLRILATSREPLSIPGEVTWRVPELNEADAVALFAERAPGAAVRTGRRPAVRLAGTDVPPARLGRAARPCPGRR